MLLLSILIAIPILILLWVVLSKKLWKKENLKHFFRNENSNYIPDGIEDIVDEVEDRIERVKEEAEDVKKSLEDLKEQTEDVIDAALGKDKKRRGRPKKTK